MGNGTCNDWYQRTLRWAEGGTSEPEGPPYPIRTAQVRQEAIGQIYNSVDSKDSPPRNIASEALRAYYSGADPWTLKQQTPTPRRQETNQATPYRQQVYPPRCPTGVRMSSPKQSTAPSTSQGRGETAGESEGTRGRSSSQGPQG